MLSIRSDGAEPPVERHDTKGPWAVLRDPVTFEKLPCREDVDAALAANASALAAFNQDDHANFTSYFAALPLQTAGYTLAINGLEVVDATALPYWIESPPFAITLMNDGVKAFEATEYRRASDLLEAALLRDQRDGCCGLADHLIDAIRFGPRQSMASASHALYYLGLSYEKEGKADRAALALDRFVHYAMVRDEVAYELAETHLRKLGSPARECRSTAPVAVTWPDPS